MITYMSYMDAAWYLPEASLTNCFDRWSCDGDNDRNLRRWGSAKLSEKGHPFSCGSTSVLCCASFVLRSLDCESFYFTFVSAAICRRGLWLKRSLRSDTVEKKNNSSLGFLVSFCRRFRVKMEEREVDMYCFQRNIPRFLKCGRIFQRGIFSKYQNDPRHNSSSENIGRVRLSWYQKSNHYNSSSTLLIPVTFGIVRFWFSDTCSRRKETGRREFE